MEVTWKMFSYVRIFVVIRISVIKTLDLAFSCFFLFSCLRGCINRYSISLCEVSNTVQNYYSQFSGLRTSSHNPLQLPLSSRTNLSICLHHISRIYSTIYVPSICVGVDYVKYLEESHVLDNASICACVVR